MDWQIKRSEDIAYYKERFHVNDLVAKVLLYHEYEEEEVDKLLNPKLIYHDFSLFSEGEMALERIEEAIENNEKICIYGDYDCDGMLATAILVEAFLKRDKQVGFHIPNRSSDGYGLNVARVEQMAKKGYTLIITVDNGVKSFDAINRANELGVDVIVSDHHEFDEEELVDACAIIHTQLSPDYPFKGISGGVVAYKLAAALLHKHDKYLYSLAAITTISDMMPLLDENRSMVKRALGFMKEEKFLPLELLLGENQNYSVQSIGFVIAPKINSFGRLPEIINPNNVIKFFLSNTSIEFKKQLASHAEKINNKRKTMVNEQYKQVLANQKVDDRFLFYYGDLHEGMIGLLAGKYTRDYYQPSFVMTYDKENDNYKGSGRGVDYLPLNLIFKQVEGHLLQYGGHEMAGGFSLEKDQLEPLKASIETYIKDHYPTLPQRKLSGLLVEPKDLTKQNIKELEILEPFGNGNEEVLLCLENVVIDHVTTLSNGKHLKFFFDIGHDMIQGLYFNHGNEYEKYQNCHTIHVLGKVSINRFRNQETINMIIEDLK